jgi:L-fucose mutarotase/ribose pyranase (RbsD/FucU family)
MIILLVAVFAGLCAATLPTRGTARPEPPRTWQQLVAERLPEYGHRNWIVIADSAYPSQSRAGIETVVTGGDHVEVVDFVLKELALNKHVEPAVYLDAELPHVGEKDARGIGEYRAQLKKLLGGRKAQSLPHEQIIDRLDRAGEKFRVLVLKTNLKLPYTSVFLELGCGYWDAEKEKRLRAALKDAGE